MKNLILLFLIVASAALGATAPKKPHVLKAEYNLSHTFVNKTHKVLPCPEYTLKIYDDVTFVYDTDMGVVRAITQKTGKKFLFEKELVKARNFRDSVYWIGDSLTYVWVKPPTVK